MSTGTVMDIAVVSTWSWGPFVSCCTPACFTWVTDKKLCACGPIGRSGSMSTRDPFRMS
jgi:hypothetical protein